MGDLLLKQGEMRNKEQKMGVLLVNIGTPDAPTAKAVSAFLSEFLHDQHVVDIMSWFWSPFLHGVILPVRSSKIAKLYQRIWMNAGSPLMVYSQRQKIALEKLVNMPVVLGMTYGQPSISCAIKLLMAQNCEKILVFPLYPQYSRTTTAAAFDKLAKSLKFKSVLPEFRFIHYYYDDTAYIDILAQSVESYWKVNGKPDILLCSYHGIPKRYADNGDPYREHCYTTTKRLIERLNCHMKIQTTFQSRFGLKKWLQPYTDKTLKQLPKDGVKRVDIITPSFSVDCLETLEEIAEQCDGIFKDAGGEVFNVIPCLNDSPAHIEMMRQLVGHYTEGW